MRKILVYCILFFSITSLVPTASAASESISNIRLSKADARPGDTLVVTADITSPSGINWVNMILYPPGGGTKGFDTYFNLIAGSEQNGTWSMNFSIPQTAENGVWNLVVGMQTKENLVKTAYGPSINVTGSTTLETKIVKINLSKVKSRPGETLIVTADITSPSGINWVNLILYPPSGGTRSFTTYFNLASGSEQNGTWSMSFVMSPTAESGVWKLVVGMESKDKLVKVAYGPNIIVSTEADELAAQAAADKAAADKAAADKAAADKVAADKAAADKAAADKEAAAKAAINNYQKNDYVVYTTSTSDLPNQPIFKTLEDCKKECSNNNTCVRFSRSKSANDNDISDCYLKKDITNNPKSYNDWAWQTFTKN